MSKSILLSGGMYFGALGIVNTSENLALTNVVSSVAVLTAVVTRSATAAVMRSVSVSPLFEVTACVGTVSLTVSPCGSL